MKRLMWGLLVSVLLVAPLAAVQQPTALDNEVALYKAEHQKAESLARTAAELQDQLDAYKVALPACIRGVAEANPEKVFDLNTLTVKDKPKAAPKK